MAAPSTRTQADAREDMLSSSLGSSAYTAMGSRAGRQVAGREQLRHVPDCAEEEYRRGPLKPAPGHLHRPAPALRAAIETQRAALAVRVRKLGTVARHAVRDMLDLGTGDARSRYTLVEYSEQFPPILGIRGMRSRFRTFWVPPNTDGYGPQLGSRFARVSVCPLPSICSYMYK